MFSVQLSAELWGLAFQSLSQGVGGVMDGLGLVFLVLVILLQRLFSCCTL